MLALRLRNRELLRAAAYLVVTAGVLGAVYLVGVVEASGERL